ncbi:zinc finger protein 462-like isoform X2 [Pristis pectinata]|uniref:zinc finger protein 462-like isoform X2 n=2 Tax=Pristis pectinata TaxID=685728 RepID=UPI00223E657F|nr:zinc finger protein 462-like isoform X2 [Pristis pectinata]
MCIKHCFSNKKLELDQLLQDTINDAIYLEAISADELRIQNLGHTKLYETISKITKGMELSEDVLVTSDKTQNSLSKLINLNKPTKDVIKPELDGKPIIESDKMMCMWCGYYTFSKQCFEDHIREQHSYFEFGKDIPASSMGLRYFGMGKNSTNNTSLKRKTSMKKRKPVRSECENISSIIAKIDGCKTSKNMPMPSTFGQRNLKKLSKFKNQSLLYVKRLCLFHCILCRFHTLYRNGILRHVRNVHFKPSGCRKLKSSVHFSSGLRAPKCCKKGCRSKELLNNYILSLEGNNFPGIIPDTGIKSENRNLAPSIVKPFFNSSKSDMNESSNCLSKEHFDSNCETSLLQQINDQLQLSVPCFTDHSDANSEMSRDSVGAPLYFSTTMTPNKKTNEDGLNSADVASSKCLALEAIVKNLKNRMLSPIKCMPAVPLLNDRSVRRKQSIPYCRTTEEQKAKWMLEAFSFLSQQKIERAAEFSRYNDTVAEIEVALSDTDDDSDKRTNSNACKNYTLRGKLKSAEDERKILCSTSSDKKKRGNVYTHMYKCDICPFSSANVTYVLLHYQEQHPEEEVSCKMIHNYSHKLDVLTKKDLPLSKCNLFLFDSELSDPSLPCLDTSSKLCFCKRCSYRGDWLSLFEHYQSAHLSKKESESQIVNYLQVREQLASPSTSNSEPQLIFECQVCNFTCSSRRVICRHYCIKRSIACAQVEGSEIVFKCALCRFTHLIREGLINHYLMFHNIEPPYRCYEKGQNDIGFLVSSNDELTAGMEKQICILCSFKAITQKELLFHYKSRHFKFYSQNKCTIECKNANLKINNLHRFDEMNILRENGNGYVNAVMDWGMCTEREMDAKAPLNCSNAEDLELISCKESESFVKALTIRGKLGNENCTPRRKTNNSFTMTVNSMNMTRFQVLENKISSREHCVKEKYSKSAVIQSIAMEGYRCRYCARHFKALAGLHNHENTHILSKNCHRSAARCSKKNMKNDIQTASSEGRSYRCPRCSYSTPLIEHLRSHSLRVHGRFLMPKLRSTTLDCQKTGGCVSQALNDGQAAYVEEGQLKLLQLFTEKIFCCDWCTFVTLSEESLLHHMDTHSLMKPYKCRLCFFEAGLQTELESHLLEQHKVKCNFDLVGEINLSEAELVTEIEEFQRKRLKKSLHEKKRIQSCIKHKGSTKMMQFPCEFCGRRFLNPLERMSHVQRHSI